MYKIYNGKTIIKVDNGFTFLIPGDSLNREYQEYLRWVELGNVPLEIDTNPESTQEIIEREQEIQLKNDSKNNFRNIPNWATWTPDVGMQTVQTNVLNGYDKQQLADYIDTNVTNIASAKTALKLLGDAVIDLREIVGVMAQAILLLRDIVVRKYS